MRTDPCRRCESRSTRKLLEIRDHQLLVRYDFLKHRAVPGAEFSGGTHEVADPGWLATDPASSASKVAWSFSFASRLMPIHEPPHTLAIPCIDTLEHGHYETFPGWEVPVQGDLCDPCLRNDTIDTRGMVATAFEQLSRNLDQVFTFH